MYHTRNSRRRVGRSQAARLDELEATLLPTPPDPIRTALDQRNAIRQWAWTVGGAPADLCRRVDALLAGDLLALLSDPAVAWQPGPPMPHPVFTPEQRIAYERIAGQVETLWHEVEALWRAEQGRPA